MAYEIRSLTQKEVDAFDGENFVDVAMLGADGVWYYAESGEAHGEAGEVTDETMFISDEDGDYIPVKSK